MPTIPGYEAKRNIEVRQPAPYMQGESAAFAKANKQISDTLVGISQRWLEVHDKMQYTKAKTERGVELAQIKQDYEMDGDFSPASQQRYNERIEQSGQTHLEGIDNRELANALDLEFEYEGNLTKINLDGNFKKKAIVEDNANFISMMDLYVQELAEANTEAAIIEKTEKIKGAIAVQVSKGGMTAKVADAYYKKSLKKRAEFDMYQNPFVVIDQLTKKDGGIYKDLGFEERQILLGTANDLKDRKEIESELLREQAFSDGENNAIDLYEKGGLTLDMLPDMNLTPEFESLMNEAMTSPRAFKAETRMPVYNALFEKVLLMEDKNISGSEIRRDILKAHVRGDLSMTNARHLLYIAKDQGGMSTVEAKYLEERSEVEKLEALQEKKAQGKVKRGNVWKNIKQVADQTGNNAKVIGNIIGRHFGKNEFEGDIGKMLQAAKEETQKQIMLEHPEFDILPENGWPHRDMWGNLIQVFPPSEKYIYGSYELIETSEGSRTHKESRQRKPFTEETQPKKPKE